MEGVLCLIDDTIVFRATQAEHDEHLERLLQRIRAVGGILNPNKCEFSRDSIEYL